MADKNIWQEIDGSVASRVGQRVFYNHNGVKCLAFVTKAGYERNEQGQITNRLIVFPPDGTPFSVDAALSSDRRVGSFDIAQPGDLTDSGKAPEGTFTPNDFAEQQQSQPAPQPGERPLEQQAQEAPPIETKAERKAREKREKRERGDAE